VLQWAKEDDTLSDIREKTEIKYNQSAQAEARASKKRRLDEATVEAFGGEI